MNHASTRNIQNIKQHMILTSVCILLNCVLTLVSLIFDLPLYIDTAGTIITSAVGGLYPGFLCAVLTNIITTIFDNSNIYFSICNAGIALFTAWFVKRFDFKKMTSVFIYIVSIGIMSGVLSSCIQWELTRTPGKHAIAEMVVSTVSAIELPYFFVYLFINVFFNIIDKAIATVIALGLIYIMPARVKESIKNSKWRQTPLSSDEIISIKNWRKDVKISSKSRITRTFLGAFLVLSISISVIAFFIFFDNEKQVATDVTFKAAAFTSKIADHKTLSQITRDEKGREICDRLQMEIYDIRDYYSNVDEIAIVKAVDNGLVYVVPPLGSAAKPYDTVELSAAMYTQLYEFGGFETAGSVSSGRLVKWGVDVTTPVFDDEGNAEFVIWAHGGVRNIFEYAKTFVEKVFLIVAPIFALTFIYALRVMDYYSVYPISTMAECMDRVAESGNSQEDMDDNVRKLRSLNITTDDELQKLYRSLCRMMSKQSEQMRNNTRLSDSTAKMQDGLIITMADLVENRDSDTGAHIQKTAAYVKIIVESLEKRGYYAEKITPKFKSDIVRSAPLHDVGKINIPDHVLNKPGKLTDEEYEIIKLHTVYGKKIMEKAIDSVGGENYLKEARNMAAYHHERWDGKGYPEKLHGEVIPLSARIMAVADVFDALTSPRVYKPAFPLDKALELIKEGSGTQFDPKCVEAFMDSLPEVKLILTKYNQTI